MRILEVITKFRIVFLSFAIFLIPVLAFFVWQNFFTKTQLQPTHFEPQIFQTGISAPQPGEMQIPNQKILSPFSHEYQKFNYCGPATAAMTLAFYGVKTNQFEAGNYLKPDKSDRHVDTTEIGQYLAQFKLKTKIRIGGDIEILEKLIAQDIPVIVQQLLRSTDDIGHYRLVRGYDNNQKVIITNDSFYGPARSMHFNDFLTLWKPFNFKFMPVYSAEKDEIVDSILGELLADEKMYQKTKNSAEKDLSKNSNDLYALLNLSESYLGLSDYKLAKENFGKAQSIGLPKRTLWYIDFPVVIYNKLGEFDKVLVLTQQVFDSGNQASSEHYYQRGLAYLSLGQNDKAKAELEKALFYQPNYKPAREVLNNI